mmetsp:Transcript_9512/g.14061  ORF Transcript_9512/g.14061 Transcript_9512/m.14061 type:complete len:123 (-) Transcript_9512:93-461(-)
MGIIKKALGATMVYCTLTTDSVWSLYEEFAGKQAPYYENFKKVFGNRMSSKFEGKKEETMQKEENTEGLLQQIGKNVEQLTTTTTKGQEKNIDLAKENLDTPEYIYENLKDVISFISNYERL